MPFTTDAVEVLLLFLIPGYIVDLILSRSIVRAPRGNTEAILSYIVWSAVTTSVSTILLVILKVLQDDLPVFWYELLRLALPLVVVPTIIGVTIAVVVAKVRVPDSVRNVLDWLGLFGVHPTPKAWDWVFSKRTECWVIVTLQDGTQIGGWYGQESFASSYPAPEDIFIEQVWRLAGKGKFMAPIERTGGVLIKGDKISKIEFFN